jgi:DNA-binding NarL/FixJ family response regulator
VRLTPTLEAIHDLVKDGLTNKEIAAARGVSEQAIKRHVSALFRHYGVNTRAALIRVWFERKVQGSAPPAD